MFLNNSSKGGGVDVPLFETIKTNVGTQPKNELQLLALDGSCFNDVYSGTAKKRRRKPPSAAEFFCCYFSLNYISLNHLNQLIFCSKNYPYICTEHL